MAKHPMAESHWRWPTLAVGIFVLVLGVLAVADRTAPSTQAAPNPFAGLTTRHPDRIDRAIQADVSPPLRSLRPIPPSESPSKEAPENVPPPLLNTTRTGPDPVLQRIFSPLIMPAPIQNFEGQPNLYGVFPPDTNGDVGRNHYFQIVNSGFQIYTKTGTSLYGPANTNTLFTGFGGLCESTNSGDPIALYDPLADRWLVSQFAIAANGSDTHQCYAISTGPDPLGSYYRYDFHVSPNSSTFEDYPKIAVWPDAYYQTANQFGGATAGAAYAFNRIKMLQGDGTAEMVYFGTTSFGMLPSDLDGTPPPAGRPDFFLAQGPTTSQLQEFQFHVDFVTPANSTFTGPIVIAVPAFNQTICTGVSRGACIDQPNTPVKLETLSSDLMYRLQYRNFPGDHETLIVNHTVNANGGNPGVAGIRWYEIRNPMTTTVAYQASTYSPDATHRWMGSAAMDHVGNIAIGFSASSTTTYPSILYAGRLVTDPLNTLAQGETTLIAGGGNQTRTQGTNDGRWGDYSMLGVDPVDDCTYWFTTEYIRTSTDIGWSTRIGSFRFPNCAAGGTATPVPTSTGTPPSASPTPQATPTLCPGGVTVTGSITNTNPTMTGRLSRGNAPDSCAALRPFPGIVSGPTPHYNVYTYTNSLASPQCISVTLNATACATSGVFSSAYLGSFDPTNLQTNYLADEGTAGPVAGYSFSVPGNSTYVVVVQEIGVNLGCAAYTLTVNPCTAGATTATPTPRPVTATPTVCAVSYLTSTLASTLIPGGTDIGNHCDDCVTTVTLPFPVTVYGTPYTVAQAGSNGDLQFVGNDPNIYNPNCLPVQQQGGTFFLSTLFPYYDDLRTDITPTIHGIFSQTLGGPGSRQFVLRWQATYFADDNAEANLEVVFSENSPNIAMIYGATDATVGSPATGVELDGTHFTASSCGTAPPAGTEVLYTPVNCGGTPTPAPPTVTSTTTPAATETSCPVTFTDVPVEYWAYGYIKWAYCHGIISGYADGSFHPEGYISRAQIAKEIVLAAGFTLITPATPTFSDVPAGYWAYSYVETAHAHGVLAGYADGTFHPAAYVTRAQIAKIIVVARGYTLVTPGTPDFNDVPPNYWAYSYIETAFQHQVVGGYDCLHLTTPTPLPTPGPCLEYRPTNLATRAQFSKILFQAYAVPRHEH